MSDRPSTLVGRFLHAVRDALRRYFVAGILFFAPIGITLWAIGWIIQRLDNLILPSLLEALGYGDEEFRIPLVGALFTVLVILLMGVIARHVFPFELTRRWEGLLRSVPVAGNIYQAVRQLFEAIFRSDTTSRFRRVVLIEYPRKGLYALAFTTGHARGLVQDATPESMINCFVPTTPNPTSGFYLLVPEQDVIEVNLTVEDAFKLVMSAGLVVPEGADRASVDPAVSMPAPQEP